MLQAARIIRSVRTFVVLASIGSQLVTSLSGQERKQAIRALPALPKQTLVSDRENPAIQEKVGRVLRLPTVTDAVTALNRQGLSTDLSGFAGLESEGKNVYALYLKGTSGYLNKNSDTGEVSLKAFIASDTGMALSVEATTDATTKEPKRLVFRDPVGGTGLEFNFAEGQLYQLSGGSEASAPSQGTLMPRAQTGTAGCVLSALGDLVKPCEGAILLNGLAQCIASIAILPESAGISSIWAIAACSSAATSLIQAVACGGVDCGLSGSQGDFTITASPGSRNITQGQSTTITITANFSSGFPGPINSFSVSNLFAGVSSSFSNSSISSSGGSTILTLTASPTAELGDRVITITAVGAGGLTRTAVFELNINPANSGSSITNLGNGQSSVGTLSQGQEANYRINLPTGATQLLIAITGSGDADLYVKYGSAPTIGSYDCRPYSATANEQCPFPNPAAGDWYIMVRGYSASSSYTLSASYTSSSSTGTPTAPHIDDVNPKNPPVGVETSFQVDGSGFQQGFAGKLWVNGNSFAVDPSKLVFVNSNRVLMIVRVGATVDANTNFGLQVVNPGNVISNIFSSGLTAVHGGGGLSIANLQITFNPNPVPSTNGRWSYTVTVKETGGVNVTLTGLHIGGNDYTSDIPSWFNLASPVIPANGQISGNFTSSGGTGGTLTWTFDGNGLTWSQSVTLQ